MDQNHLSTKAEEKILPISKTGEVFPWQNVRLPTFVCPAKYVLTIKPNLTSFENSGKVIISFKVTKETNYIVLHSEKLNLTKTAVLQEGCKDIPVLQVLECEKLEQLYVKVDKLLKPDEDYELHIEFQQCLEEGLSGFFLNSWETANGEKRYLAATDFEPTRARSAFPCFDEPAMKAVFQLTIVHRDRYTAYSNTDIKQVLPHVDRWTTTIFNETPIMSTYLVAFIICDFAELHRKNEDGIDVRVLIPPHHANQAEFALETACNILHYFSNFFNTPYPLPKLDLIALPDFTHCMENWGLITFQSGCMLYNATETSGLRQEIVANVITHEIAHQWFGNLVTMEWWSDLWLKEGFADFMAYLALDYEHPDWNMMQEFVLDETHAALDLDSLDTSHPIMVDVNDPAGISSVFDDISYMKGAAILFMLKDFLGIETLQKGISHYLNKYPFKNATTQDLWDSFTEVMQSGQVDISKVMDTWTRQKGYPLLKVTRQNGNVQICQNRFLLAPPDPDGSEPCDVSPYGYKWCVPVSYVTDKDKEKKSLLLNMNDEEFQLSSEVSWVKLNIGQTGFYRVMYDEELWTGLINQLQNDCEVFTPIDRANLLDDAFILCRCGTLDSRLCMNLTRYLEKEGNNIPWRIALDHFHYFIDMLQKGPALELLKKYLRQLLMPALKTLGWNDEGDHATRKFRSAILRASVKCNDEETIEQAKLRFRKWMDNDQRVAPNLRCVVYATAIKYGNEEEWQFCWKKYCESQMPSEKSMLLSSLGQTQNLDKLSEFLTYSFDRSKIRREDTEKVINAVAYNSCGSVIAWKFVKANWQHIIDLYGRDGATMNWIIPMYTCYINTKPEYDEVKSFFAGVEMGAGIRAVQQSLERIRANICWKKNAEASLIQWLENHFKN